MRSKHFAVLMSFNPYSQRKISWREENGRASMRHGVTLYIYPQNVWGNPARRTKLLCDTDRESDNSVKETTKVVLMNEMLLLFALSTNISFVWKLLKTTGRRSIRVGSNELFVLRLSLLCFYGLVCIYLLKFRGLKK